jgi:hypothetical protein
MDGDPNFRLKAFAVLACVAGVFLVVYVAQRCWFWMKSHRRKDVETSRIAPVFDFGLLGLGALVIWLAIEALVLAVITADLPIQPEGTSKIAEVEIGKLDADSGQLNLLFYPVDSAGRRIAEQRRPVLTNGDHFELELQFLLWRPTLRWLGEGGFFQFVSLGGYAASGAPLARTMLEPVELPRTVGASFFLRPPSTSVVRQRCEEGEIYSIILEQLPDGGRRVVVELHAP